MAVDLEYVEKILEMRGMKRIEIVNYFISIGGKVIDDEKFSGKGWQAEIAKEKLVILGSLKIPATIVTLRCREEISEQMLYAFRLRFLSAGG
ncbi:MAG: hypothetical protein ACJAX4_001045 [Clostridium sp.]